MAIEDGFQLALDLGNAAEEQAQSGKEMDIEKVLRGYQNKRVLRSSAIHGLAGMAAVAASTYKAYMGEGLGPLSWIQQWKVPHFGRVRSFHPLSHRCLLHFLRCVPCTSGNQPTLSLTMQLHSCAVAPSKSGLVCPA